MGPLFASLVRRNPLGGVRVSRAAVARLWVACGLLTASVGVGVLAGVGYGLIALGVAAVGFGLTVDVDGGS